LCPQAWQLARTRCASLCPAVIPVQANHRRYTEYHERLLKAPRTGA
jgi:hypothetical protein